MAGRKRDDKPKRFWVPPAAKQADKNSSSGESGGTDNRFWVRKEPLPTDTIWRGNADRMPPRYSKDRQWNCPSCDVKPGNRHEQWCPRYLYQLNPYNAEAYDDELFLANYMETQIYSGEGHPETEKPIKIGEYLLETAGIVKRKRPAFDELAEGELPF